MEIKKLCCQNSFEQDQPMLDSEDQISDLPISVLHHILSFLPMKVVGKTSVLSKRWQYIWDTYPFLEFLHDCFGVKKPPFIVNEDDRAEYTRYTEAMERFAEIVDHKLHKFCQHEFEIQKFILSVPLSQTEFNFYILRWINLVAQKHVKELHLELTSGSCQLHVPKTIYTSLTVLKLWGRIYVRGMLIFDDHEFPCLEFVSLSGCFIQRGLKINHHGLKRLELKHCEGLDKIKISAPNLSSFHGVCSFIPSAFSFKAPFKPTNLKFSLNEIDDNIDSSWFIKLKKYLHKQNQTKVVNICIIPNLQVKNTFTREEASKRCNFPSHALSVLSLKLSSPLDYGAFMEGILWSCHPQVLSIILNNNTCTREFYQFLIDSLMTDGGNQDCCHSSETKCWVHSLNVKFVVLEDVRTGVRLKGPFSRNALMKAMPVSRVIVHFHLTW